MTLFDRLEDGAVGFTKCILFANK